ncbi:hypothetical protein ERO13_A02G152800v2 [Gossypium hirsutum]|uniref:Transcriptional coactivator Hfi1/Transcriptional adapter 1 n=4 Tax=Gossypium TaxID=3633 RepID=A0ABM2Z042_GOSHI|nr:uncharacterized protein LOC107932588 [Gossypium hirsutum]XP_040936116.1 uncharacterized protein LOC107932588 [Gossypium hirsutum]XP_040936123.1 uncharacterized protein LOC107932588 [Gossypium hirsutum]TYH28931.1 hypothetical protein ES288_A02G183500v1 [Gossypium darwinii]TYI40749.1 hypothetical protein ES332_A02G185200v1 [Gossypium tomentosum]TYJ47190.1 hypothetical protein E1A91_A02G171100v1 [Gossypium mustelinum]KAG4212244.1 hypothetical protein ERO13_A02G152800v2 [Gossypium hirsutum]KA
MPGDRYFTRVDTSELKSRIERKIGRVNAGKYFHLVARFLSLKIGKPEFDKLCIDTIGRENVYLHNHLLRSIIRNALFSKNPALKLEGSLSVELPNGHRRSNLQSLCKDIPQSPRKGRTPNLRDRKLRDRLSPLGPHGKNPKVQQQQSVTELLSLGSRPPGSVEDGEEVNQAEGSPSIHSRSPVRAPLGISFNAKETWKVPRSGLESAPGTCHYRGELPDTSSLKKRLERKLEMEGLSFSVDSADVLNNCLDVFLKRLIKPCLELSSSRSGQKLIEPGHNWCMSSLNRMQPVKFGLKQSRHISASMLDFQVAMELNPFILGADWPTQLEKVCLLALESEQYFARLFGSEAGSIPSNFEVFRL